MVANVIGGLQSVSRVGKIFVQKLVPAWYQKLAPEAHIGSHGTFMFWVLVCDAS